MAGKFYICATPIGNLGDITIRALEVLKQADYIVCEDKRVTKILIDKYEINVPLLDCHKFNEKQRSEKIIELLNEEKNIVFVSDAGTPLISDPGSILLQEIYKNNISITSLPGACAVSVFLSMLPRNTEEFAFIGFIPRSKNSQIQILNKYKNTNCIFYESPLRLMNTLLNIKNELGNDIKVSIGRELTKVFEEVKTGKINDIIEYYQTHTLKGEIAVMIYSRCYNDINDEELKVNIKLLKNEGYSTKDISKILSLLYKENKNKIYKIAECT